MKQLSLWFAFFASAVLAGLLPVSCTKENGALDPLSMSNKTSMAANKPSPPPSTSPADPAIAYEDRGTGKVMVMNADGSNQTVVASGGLPSWSPNGHSIFFEGSVGGVGGFAIVDVAVTTGNKVIASNLRHVPITQPGTANGGRWSPLGDQIVFIFEDQNVYTIPPTGGTAKIVYTSPAGLMPFDPEWSQDGSKIVFTEWNDAFTQSNLQVLDLTTKIITTVRPLTTEMIYGPTWSRHGDRIAYTGSGIRTVTPTANATPVNVTSGGYQTWSPDDSKLAFTGGRKSSIETYAFSGGAITILASSGVFADWRRF